MSVRPLVVAFDVIETLFSLDPVRERFREVGLPADALPVFFAQLLRDAFALEVAQTYRPFSDVASASLEVTLAGHGVEPESTRVARVLSAFAELPAHGDVRPALERLHRAGIRIVTLTNGSAENTARLLARAGLQGLIEKSLSIDEVRHWKPHRAVYLHAATAARCEPGRVALIAAHAWDVHGAKQAGLLAGWVRRQDQRFSAAMSPPDVRGNTLAEVVDALLALPAS